MERLSDKPLGDALGTLMDERARRPRGRLGLPFVLARRAASSFVMSGVIVNLVL